MMNRILRFPLLAALCLTLVVPLSAHAQEQAGQGRGQAQQQSSQDQRRQRSEGDAQRLPPESVTHHTIELPGHTVHLTATAGALTLVDQQGKPQVEIGFVAYTRDGADPATRPVTFAVNGGPGASSAYLNLLAIGPWRLNLDGPAISPSTSPVLEPNAETWLDFTDLVFIDPPGTGFSRILGGDQVREHFYSVQGDIDGLAAFVMRWLKEKNRLVSPKFFVGESYGGFRGPLLAQKLQSDQGVGFSALFLVSPVLDFDWIDQNSIAPWADAARLPSLAAASLARQGPISRKSLEDVERYASGEYLVDLFRGTQDREAVERVSRRVAELTGLDPDLVRRLAGRVDMRTFQREMRRRSKEVVSAYDTGVAGADPDPTANRSRFEDPVLTAMTAPLTSAIVHHLTDTLNYKFDGRYELLNGSVSRNWRWGGGRDAPENTDELKSAMALDGQMRVLIAHGFTDLVTPYYATQLILNQIPDLGPERRLALKVYDGGHMFYSRAASRQAFRDDVRKIVEDVLQARAVNRD